MISYRKCRVIFECVFCGWFVFLDTKFFGLPGGPGGDAFLPEIIEACCSVAVPVSRDAVHDFFMMTGFEAVQQGLELGTIPGCIE